MLRHLTIRNVVLIEKLDLHFEAGLTAFTGETGAGKSILLDSLGLAMGQRADPALIRHGESQASVTAEFSLTDHPQIRQLLAEQGIDAEEELILRRILSPDGKSRAFVNEEAVSAGFLKKIAQHLVEIEGQFETHGLLDQSTHLFHLDEYGKLTKKREEVSRLYQAWRQAEDAYRVRLEQWELAKREEEYLRHALTELELADPQMGEEEALVQERTSLAQHEQIADAIDSTLNELGGENSLERVLSRARRKLERWQEEEKFVPILAALERSALELDEAMELLTNARRNLNNQPSRLEKIEERLYLLRDLARKHRIPTSSLPDLLKEMRVKIEGIDQGGADLDALQKEGKVKRDAYEQASSLLTEGRKKAAKDMDQRVNKELPALKLEKAYFSTRIDELAEGQWTATGRDKIHFAVSTNPGTPPGPIDKIASGGELARFMLALKVTLASDQSVATLVFDEVDTGIGGATAAAVGERLKRLGKKCQVLAVTHSPQVAALAQHHLRVEKSGKGIIKTEVSRLSKEQRREEIARMLSGATITEEARAAAGKLLTGLA